ncbi:MAG TPA: diacylglycerol kinase family protein [Thermoleophilaceae bacterium]
MNSIEHLRRQLGWEPVEPPGHPVLFINPRSGGGKSTEVSLPERAAELGIEPILLEPEHDLAELVAGAVGGGADLLGMAGGDGSLAVVAAAACAHDLPFVCVPAGTRNHFALDVGVLRHDLLGALAAFTHGLERRIDVAEVNDRVFLNNVSLGIYADAVRRPDYRGAKLLTLLETAREVLGPEASAPGVEVTDDKGHDHRDPAVVLVSNNPYALDRPLARGTRPRLDGGQLGIVVLERPGSRRVRPDRAWAAASLDVVAAATVDAARDGEAIRLAPPLRFAIRPRALRVRISSDHPGVSPSGLLSARGRPSRDAEPS